MYAGKSHLMINHGGDFMGEDGRSYFAEVDRAIAAINKF